MSSDLSGLALGLGAALAWGLTDTVAMVASRRLGSLRATAGVQLVTLVAIVGMMAIRGGAVPVDAAIVVTAFTCGALSACAYLAFFTALRHGPISVVSPVVSLYGSLTVVLAVAFLGEGLRPGQAVGVVVAATGVVLAAVVFQRDWRQTRLVSAGAGYAVVALVAFALSVVLISGPIRAVGWLPALLLARIANTATVWLVLGATRIVPLAWRPDSRPIDRRSIGIVIVAATLDLAGFVSFALGISIAPTWLVGLSSSFGPVLAVAVGVALLQERPRPLQWAGLGLVAASVVLIGLA